MTDRDELLAQAEAARLPALERAWVAALQGVNAEKDAAKLPELVKAEAVTRAALAAARGQAAGPAAAAEPGFNGLEAVAHLRALGYQVAKSKLYADAKAGLLGRDGSTGRFTRRALEKYAAAHCRPLAGERPDEAAARLAMEKLEEEVRHRRALAERTEVENRVRAAELIPRAIVEKELVSRALVLKSDLSAWAHEAPAAVVDLVGGRLDAVHELQAYLVEVLEDLLDRYSDEREFVAVLTPTADGGAR